jgi:cysteine-rich repeat protein
MRALGLTVAVLVSALTSGCSCGSDTLGMTCSTDRDCSDGELCDRVTLVCVAAGGGDAGGRDGGGPGTDAGPLIDAGPIVCGDGTITPPEVCDDGNTAPGDGCDASCRAESGCGDGVVDPATEECDDANGSVGDGCDTSCRVELPPSCGDGNLDLAEGEQCDDGGTGAGDGCSATCQFETVGASCGNNTTDNPEACDDGNVANGDACNPTCNLTNMVTTFVGDGTQASVDGTGTAAQVDGGGTLAVDDDYLWYAEDGNCGGGTQNPGHLRRIEISSGVVTTIATLNSCEAAGIATDGVGMVWVAGTDITSGNAAIYAIDTNASSPAATIVAGDNPCAATGCYAEGPPGTATFAGIRGLTWWAGMLYIVDPTAGMVRRLDPTTNEVFDVAGNPFNNGYTDAVGRAAQFQSPRYIVSDNSGNLYVSETNHGSIRVVNAGTGRVTTLVGNGSPGYVDAIGAAARAHRPRGITSDGTSVYWVEFNAHAVRQAIIATQSVSTLAGVVTQCPATACTGSDVCSSGVCLPPSSGAPVGGGWVDATGTTAEFFAPWGIAFHFPSRSLFITDTVNHRIRRIR